MDHDNYVAVLWNVVLSFAKDDRPRQNLRHYKTFLFDENRIVVFVAAGPLEAYVLLVHGDMEIDVEVGKNRLVQKGWGYFLKLRRLVKVTNINKWRHKKITTMGAPFWRNILRTKKSTTLTVVALGKALAITHFVK